MKLEKASDVAAFAIGSEGAHRTFIRHLFHHTVKQPAAAYGADTMDRLLESFEKSAFNVRDLLLETALTAALRGLPVEVAQPVSAENGK